jgi:hypothetical protein
MTHDDHKCSLLSASGNRRYRIPTSTLYISKLIMETGNPGYFPLYGSPRTSTGHNALKGPASFWRSALQMFSLIFPRWPLQESRSGETVVRLRPTTPCSASRASRSPQ